MRRRKEALAAPPPPAATLLEGLALPWAGPTASEWEPGQSPHHGPHERSWTEKAGSCLTCASQQPLAA